MQHEPGDRLDVLLMLGTSQLRGSSARALALAERLPAQRIALRVLTTEPIRGLKKRLKKADLRTSRYLNWPVLGPLARQFLATDFKAHPPEIIDIQHRSLHPVGAWLARRLSVPYVVTMHDYLRERERFVIDRQWCQRVIAVSDSVRTELIERTRLPEEMVTVIPSGVLPPPVTELSSLLTSGRAPVIGTAGPLESGKGLTHFLRSAVRVLKARPDAMFVIAGSGPEERSLRRLAMDLQISHAVTILPNLLDFTPALRAMDIFVLPALKQGLGSTILDAMARGLPVIASDSGGVFSVVVDGVTGLLVPPKDEVALAERMRFLLDNPDRARALGAAGRQRIIDHFHIDRMVGATAHLYRQVSAPAITTTLPAAR
ncbi:glycosyltransferase family 4 protein [Planctomicrobium piriforme]|uniref:Glycosyltransferase involved in cell wall bisynthesis n=1 Tax=Planctomicrobium piriforme TaxID=1576369 RepID=A0A1I3F0J4_9PLAN|nr:glycosyltransferase family 4 protein [Planctomicrobium piriforme]SFI04744.1 Glycosyltransferase involved in cell wall bisynthesis [Planctomicrobium piriforme]